MDGINNNSNITEDIYKRTTKLTKFLLKIEPSISKLLFLSSIAFFLFETTILNLSHGIENLLNPLTWIFLFPNFIMFIIFPIHFYFKSEKKLSPNLIKTFELFTTLVLMIGGFIVNIIPKFQLCDISLYQAGCVEMPGSFLVGILIIALITGFLNNIKSKLDDVNYNIEKSSDYERIVNLIQIKIIEIEKILKDNLNKIENLLNEMNREGYLHAKEKIANILNENNELYEDIIFYKQQLNLLEDSPQHLILRAEIAYNEGKYQEGIDLSRKAMVNDVNNDYNKYILALNLSGIQNYSEAYKIFLELLKENYDLNYIDFEVLSKILENLDMSEASRAAKGKDIELIYSTLGLNDIYIKSKRNKIVEYIVIVILLLIIIILLIYSTFFI